VLSNKLKETSIEPVLAFEIDGIETIYSTGILRKIPRYGDENLFYDNPSFRYGGLVPLDEIKLESIITLQGTTTSIKQNLNPDKARGSGISSMNIVLVDKDQKATRLATGEQGELLFRKCKVWVGFGENSAFREDFILLFRGIIESIDIEQGKVRFQLSSPDQKRRVLLLPKGDTETSVAMTNSQTTVPLKSAENFFVTPEHPLYSPRDESLKSYVRIEDEIIRYTGISGNTLTGCTRGQLGTTAVAHDINTQAETFFTLEGNAMELALKVMLSDKGTDPYLSGLEASSVNQALTQSLTNSIYFGGVNVRREYNVRVGDFVRTAGFTQGANNFSTWREILAVNVLETGSYITVDQALALEPSATGTVDFLSRWNSLGAMGMNLVPDEVDIEKHWFLRSNFLFNFSYRFFLRDSIENGKEWLESEIYRPTSCYSLPADKEGLARMSVGMHISPLPNESIVTISKANITKPDNLSVRRSVNKNYYNSILTKFQDLPLEDEFFRKVFVVSGTQFLTAFKGNKTLVIESRGLRDDLSGDTLSLAAGKRLLNRYQAAAEYIDGLEIFFSTAVQINVGDIVMFDPEGLNVSNPTDNDRQRSAGLWEVVNKDIDVKGKARIDLVNTAFSIEARFGLWSAASKVRTVLSQTEFVIEPFSAFPKFGAANEWQKWNNIPGLGVKIRSANWANVHETRLVNVSLNTLTVETAPSFTLTAGMILELSSYSSTFTTENQKLIYTHWTDDDNNFADGGLPYVWI